MVDSQETPNMYPNLSATPLNVSLNDQQHFRLNKMNEIKYYFVAEIKERELITKRLSEYIVSFDYFDKPLIFLSVTTGSTSIASFANCHWSTCRNKKCKFYSCIFNLYRDYEKTVKNDKK